MPIILPRHWLEQGPCLCFQISRKIQDRVKGGGGGRGRGRGWEIVLVDKSLGIMRSSHFQTFGLKNICKYILKFIEKARRNNGLTAPSNSGFTRKLKTGEIFHSNPPPPHPPPANYPIISPLITNLHQIDTLLKRWLKAVYQCKDSVKVRYLFEKGPPSCLTLPQRGGGGAPCMWRIHKKIVVLI